MKRGDKAVAESIGAIVLLAMAITVFSVIYINVLSDDGPTDNVFTTITAKMETNDYVPNTIVFENEHGETLGQDTKILLYINGTLYENGLTIKDLVSLYPEKPQLYLNDGWNVGEKLYPVHPRLILEDVPIYTNIIDEESNSIVFWGTLQAGNITKMGGIWHFNESHWNHTVKEVKDSSGNGNHGTAYNNANTTYNENVSIGADKSGHFNYPTNDYVNVPNNHSLNIRNNLTIEAWIKPENYDLSGYYGLKEKFGYRPYIINSNNSKNIYIAVSQDQSNVGKIQTFYISHLDSHNITHKEYGNGSATPDESMTPVITHISGDIYVVAYNDWLGGSSQYLTLQRFNINSAGDIDFVGYPISDNNNSRMDDSNRPSIIKVSEDVFAVAYNIKTDKDKKDYGIIRTVKISSDVTWDFVDFDYFENEGQGYEPIIINVDGDLYAIAYRGSSGYIFIKTYTIDSNDGSITYKSLFNTKNYGYEPSFIHVSGSVFAIAYRLPSDSGIINTFKIYKDGTIDGSEIDNNYFNDLNFFNPNIICLSPEHFAITYATNSKSSNSEGYYILLRIENNGFIFNIEKPEKIIIEEKPFLHPICVRISDRAFAVVFTTQTHGGKLQIVTPEYFSDETDTGVISKEGSYGIYANSTKLVGHITTKTEILSIETSIDSSVWHHVILTYNDTEMVLYVDGNKISSIDSKGAISISNKDLKFGYLYQGYIDEIAIFDYVLSSDDIKNHSDSFIGIWSFF